MSVTLAAWRPRAMVRPTNSQPLTGRRVTEFGLRVGFWPCLKAPFVTVTFWRWRFDMWLGLPSYAARSTRKATPAAVTSETKGQRL